MYADKSHSMTMSEVINHIHNNPTKPIPSVKVLKTALETPQTNIKELLEYINEHGLPPEYLLIGLKAKERELKRIGRFFSLMSWMMREYFVSTEYLIKEFYVPLFSGLTMADDLSSVLKKMMDTSSGQGCDDYEYITIANHIDYEKWNNFQRKESNKHVFRVMGQFMGLNEIFVKTHEIFRDSLIYYGERPDLLTVVNGRIENKYEGIKACWRNQKGGLEGLRQKGWSILSLLVIRREAMERNTRVKTLAQGDNQVICTHYKLPKFNNTERLAKELRNVAENNNKIMDRIYRGAEKIGLFINRDETIQSPDLLIYGKVPIFRGNMMPLEVKRWARVTCSTNDQLPSCANTLSSVSTNALTVAQYSNSVLQAMDLYVWFGTFT